MQSGWMLEGVHDPITKMGDDVRHCCGFDGDDELAFDSLASSCLSPSTRGNTNFSLRPIYLPRHTAPTLNGQSLHNHRIVMRAGERTAKSVWTARSLPFFSHPVSGTDEKKAKTRRRCACGGRIPRGVSSRMSENGLLYVYQRTMRNGSPGTAFSAPVCVAA